MAQQLGLSVGGGAATAAEETPTEEDMFGDMTMDF